MPIKQGGQWEPLKTPMAPHISEVVSRLQQNLRACGNTQKTVGVGVGDLQRVLHHIGGLELIRDLFVGAQAVSENSSDMLKTRRAICDYVDAYWPTIERWIANEAFPAYQGSDGKWRSSKRAVDLWNEQKALNSPKS